MAETTPRIWHLLKMVFSEDWAGHSVFTIGFVFISSIIVTVLNAAGGLPLVGAWIADIVETTQLQLTKRNPYLQ